MPKKKKVESKVAVQSVGSITKTKMAIAVTFLGIAALAAGMVPGNSSKACVSDDIHGTDKLAQVCQGDTVAYGPPGIAFLYIKGFNDSRVIIHPLKQLDDPAIYSYGSASNFSVNKNETVHFSVPNSPYKYSLYYRGMNKIGQAILYFGVVEEGPEFTCEDTDGGVDYYNFGTVTGASTTGDIITVDDYCYDLTKYTKQEDGSYKKYTNYNYVLEYSCGEDNKVVFDYHDCESENKLCVDGACVATSTLPAFTCEDTDGGLNYDTFGSVNYVTTTGEIVSAEDYCILYAGESLMEFACDEYPSTGSWYNCASEGKICEDGACI